LDPRFISDHKPNVNKGFNVIEEVELFDLLHINLLPLKKICPQMFIALILSLNLGSEVSNIESSGDVPVTQKLCLVGIISYPLHNLVRAICLSDKLALPS